MIIFLFGKVVQEVNMLAITNVDGAGGSSAEFVEMFISKVSMKFYIVIMIFFVLAIDGFAGYGTESMVVAVTTFVENSGASG